MLDDFVNLGLREVACGSFDWRIRIAATEARQEATKQCKETRPHKDGIIPNTTADEQLVADFLERAARRSQRTLIHLIWSNDRGFICEWQLRLSSQGRPTGHAAAPLQSKDTHVPLATRRDMVPTRYPTLKTYLLRFFADGKGEAREFRFNACDAADALIFAHEEARERSAELWCEGRKLCSIRREASDAWSINPAA